MCSPCRVFRPCDLVIGDVIGKGFFGQVRKVLCVILFQQIKYSLSGSKSNIIKLILKAYKEPQLDVQIQTEIES